MNQMNFILIVLKNISQLKKFECLKIDTDLKYKKNDQNKSIIKIVPFQKLILKNNNKYSHLQQIIKMLMEAFITNPILRSNQTSSIQKYLQRIIQSRKGLNNIRQKISNILKTLNDKQFVNQAINNLAIPKNFISQSYIDSRTDQELNKVYVALLALKKEVLRIKRYSDVAQHKDALPFQLSKPIVQNKGKLQVKKIKQKNYMYLKRQISTQKRIRNAIQKQLQYRQRLQRRQRKYEQSIKLKQQLNEKRKQMAKSMNKKAIQVYEKQKQKEEKWYQNIIKSQPQYQFVSDSKSSQIKRNLCTASSTKRNLHYQLIKQRINKSKLQLQNQINQKQIQRVIKQNSFKQWKHRRMNSLNQKFLQKQLKSQQIRSRKYNHSIQEQQQKLKRLIAKQIRISQIRTKQKEKRQSQLNQSQTNTLITSINLYRNSDVHNNKTDIDYQKQNEKQNKIIQKINKKNQIRKIILNQKVLRIKEKHKIQNQRRQAYKKSQIKLLTQVTNNNDSFIYQKDFNNNFTININVTSNKESARQSLKNSNNQINKPCINQLQQNLVDFQEQNIRKKHQNNIKSISCQQTIMKLRKLPKSILQKKLKDLKNKELHQILAKNIVNSLIH